MAYHVIQVICILGGLRHILVGNEAVLADFAEEFRRELSRSRRTRSRDDRHLRRGLADVQRGIERCLDFIVSGDAASSSVLNRRTELEERERALEAQLAQAGRDRVVEIHPNLPALYRRKVAELTVALSDEGRSAEAAEAIRALLQEIRLVPEGDGLGIELVGALAGLLSRQDARSPGEVISGARQITVVAGARNHLNLLFCAPGLRQGHLLQVG